mgnify:CR=1 FL=1
MLITIKEELMLGKKPDVTVPEGCWMAGGAVRRWFTGEPQNSDVDLFTSSEEIAKANIPSSAKEFKNCWTYRENGHKVQFIKIYFPTVIDCVSKFDFTICQFVYVKGYVQATLDAIITASRKRLAVAAIQPSYEMDSLRRAFKYSKAGYSPCAGTIRELFKAIQGATTEQKENMSERWD